MRDSTSSGSGGGPAWLPSSQLLNQMVRPSDQAHQLPSSHFSSISPGMTMRHPPASPTPTRFRR